MDLRQVRSGVCAVPAFACLPPDMIERVGMAMLWAGNVRALGDGEFLYTEGDDHNHTGCVLLQGAVDVVRGQAEPIRRTAPDLFGEMHQLVDTAQCTATVQATQNATVLEFPWHDFIRAASTVLSQAEQLELKNALLRLSDERSA